MDASSFGFSGDLGYAASQVVNIGFTASDPLFIRSQVFR